MVDALYKPDSTQKENKSHNKISGHYITKINSELLTLFKGN
jgi:hypothetical protein